MLSLLPYWLALHTGVLAPSTSQAMRDLLLRSVFNPNTATAMGMAHACLSTSGLNDRAADRQAKKNRLFLTANGNVCV